MTLYLIILVLSIALYYQLVIVRPRGVAKRPDTTEQDEKQLLDFLVKQNEESVKAFNAHQERNK